MKIPRSVQRENRGARTEKEREREQRRAAKPSGERKKLHLASLRLARAGIALEFECEFEFEFEFQFEFTPSFSRLVCLSRLFASSLRAHFALVGLCLALHSRLASSIYFTLYPNWIRSDPNWIQFARSNGNSHSKLWTLSQRRCLSYGRHDGTRWTSAEKLIRPRRRPRRSKRESRSEKTESEQRSRAEKRNGKQMARSKETCAQVQCNSMQIQRVVDIVRCKPKQNHSTSKSH